AAAVLAGRLLARSPARVVLEVHGDWETATRLYGSSLRRLLEPVSRMLARAAVRRADAVRTVSPFTSSLVRALGVDPAATFTTYYDVSAFAASPPAPLPTEPPAIFERLPSEGVAAALDAATVLVLPSFSEGLPRVAMEAFVRGRGVVGARAGGIPDIVEDGRSGLLVPAGDAGALADALVRALAEPKLAETLADGARAESA